MNRHPSLSWPWRRVVKTVAHWAYRICYPTNRATLNWRASLADYARSLMFDYFGAMDARKGVETPKIIFKIPLPKTEVLEIYLRWVALFFVDFLEVVIASRRGSVDPWNTYHFFRIWRNYAHRGRCIFLAFSYLIKGIKMCRLQVAPFGGGFGARWMPPNASL